MVDSSEQILGRRRVDVMAKRANFERLARKAARGNEAAQRLLPKARKAFMEAREQYEQEFGPWRG